MTRSRSGDAVSTESARNGFVAGTAVMRASVFGSQRADLRAQEASLVLHRRKKSFERCELRLEPILVRVQRGGHLVDLVADQLLVVLVPVLRRRDVAGQRVGGVGDHLVEP